MNNAQLISALLLLAAISVAVIVVVVRNILREMNGLADEDESQAERRTEERKNQRIARELRKRRDGL